MSHFKMSFIEVFLYTKRFQIMCLIASMGAGHSAWHLKNKLPYHTMHYFQHSNLEHMVQETCFSVTM